MLKDMSKVEKVDHMAVLRKKIKTDVLSSKYRSRISSFVGDMAKDPVFVKD